MRLEPNNHFECGRIRGDVFIAKIQGNIDKEHLIGRDGEPDSKDVWKNRLAGVVYQQIPRNFIEPSKCRSTGHCPSRRSALLQKMLSLDILDDLQDIDLTGSMENRNITEPKPTGQRWSEIRLGEYLKISLMLGQERGEMERPLETLAACEIGDQNLDQKGSGERHVSLPLSVMCNQMRKIRGQVNKLIQDKYSPKHMAKKARSTVGYNDQKLSIQKTLAINANADSLMQTKEQTPQQILADPKAKSTGKGLRHLLSFNRDKLSKSPNDKHSTSQVSRMEGNPSAQNGKEGDEKFPPNLKVGPRSQEKQRPTYHLFQRETINDKLRHSDDTPESFGKEPSCLHHKSILKDQHCKTNS